MKSTLLTSSARAQVREFGGDLAQLDHQAFTRLTEGGPLFRCGLIKLTAEAFHSVVPESMWAALTLHQCGNWGDCDPYDVAKNEEQLDLWGLVSSTWRAKGNCEFIIYTTLEPEHEQTVVYLAPESEVMCDPPAAEFELGNVVIEDTVASVPYTYIWHALREHQAGSPGDTGVFRRRESFDLGDTPVSYWARQDELGFSFPPFWVLTHLSQPRLTTVFTGGGDSAP